MSYTFDAAAFEEQVLCADWMVADMERRANNVADLARATAPVGPEGDPHRGLYKESFVVSSGIQNEKTRRAYGEVRNDVRYAAALEYGDGDTEKHRTLGKALDAARL